ncbi:MAG: hypothetical protein KBG75_03220 [Pseudomonadales bacterium]|nr:hypothetical protein [Pseudomonadales bacterium]
MSVCVLEFNDIALALGDEQGLRASSPGYANIGREPVLIGAPARAQARIDPRQTLNQFWMRLGTEPLHHARAQVRHHADLAYLQLLQLHEEAGKPDELIFAVPGSFSKEQLAILLGIAQRCPFRAVGLVDAALAAASTSPIADAALHLDLQLHQCVVTQLARDGDTLQRVGVRVLPGTGLLQMQERWARHAAAEFIQQTRFDPLHAATTEQQLYDQMPQWLDTLNEQSDVSAGLLNGGNSYHAKLRSADMLEAVRPLYLQLSEALAGDFGALLLSPRIARLPRIGQFIGAASALAADAVARACLLHAPIIRCDDAALRFVTRLPASGSRASADANRPKTLTSGVEVVTPSHLVLGARAWRLDPGKLYLYRDGHANWQLSRRAPDHATLVLSWEANAWWLSSVNGTTVQVDGVTLQRPLRVNAGTRINLPDHGDTGLRLIAEESVTGDGA